jgi:hypothetical protein
MLQSFIDRVGVDLLDENQEFAHLAPTKIKYVGNGSYSTASGVQFSAENRIGTVTKEEYDSLVQLDAFSGE